MELHIIKGEKCMNLHHKHMQLLLTNRIVLHKLQLGFESVSCHHVIITCPSHANKSHNDASSRKIINKNKRQVCYCKFL